MADNRSVFQPVEPQQLTGPFSGFLTPPSPNQTQQQFQQIPAKVSTGGGLAMVLSTFIEGATKGRIKAYEQKENEKLQKLTILNSYMQQIMNDPDLTPEAKQQAQQGYYRALGGETLDAAGKPSKSKDGEQGPAHHFANIMRDVAQGMTGGKSGKGAPDPGDAIMAIHGELYGPNGKPKPQYTVTGQAQNFAAQADAVFKQYPPGTPPETIAADPKLASIMVQWQRVDPQGAATYFSTREQAYPAQPSVAAQEQEISQIRGKQPPTSQNQPGAAPNPPQASVAPPNASYNPRASMAQPPGVASLGGAQPIPLAPNNIGPLGGAQPIPPGSPLRPQDLQPLQGPPVIPSQTVIPGVGAGTVGPTGLELSGKQLSYLENRKRAEPIGDYQLGDGQRLIGRIVQLDDGPAFFDQANRQLNVDIANLKPYQPRQPINIMNPNTGVGFSAMRDKETGKIYDHNNIPYPEAMQNWQEGTSYIRPLEGKKIGVNQQGHPVIMEPSGIMRVDNSVTLKATAADNWMAHFNLNMEAQEARDARSAMRQVTMESIRNVNRINLAADAKLAAINRDLTMKGKKGEDAKKEVENQRKAELDNEKQMIDAAKGSLGTENLDFDYPPRTGGASKPKTKPAGSTPPPAAPTTGKALLGTGLFGN